MNAKRKQRKSKEKNRADPKRCSGLLLAKSKWCKEDIFYKRHNLTHVSFNSLKVFFKRNDTGSVLYPYG